MTRRFTPGVRFDICDDEGRTIASFPELPQATDYAQRRTGRCDLFEIRTSDTGRVDVALLFECSKGALASTGRSLD